MSEPILSIQNLQVNYGGIEAVKGISFDVPEGEIVTLIGANGAGKSSTPRSTPSPASSAARASSSHCSQRAEKSCFEEKTSREKTLLRSSPGVLRWFRKGGGFLRI